MGLKIRLTYSIMSCMKLEQTLQRCGTRFNRAIPCDSDLFMYHTIAYIIKHRYINIYIYIYIRTDFTVILLSTFNFFGAVCVIAYLLTLVAKVLSDYVLVLPCLVCMFQVILPNGNDFSTFLRHPLHH